MVVGSGIINWAMASDSEEESYSPRRRRDIRMEPSQMGVYDEIVNDVLMKIKAHRAGVFARKSRQSNFPHREGVDHMTPGCESYPESSLCHNHVVDASSMMDSMDDTASKQTFKAPSTTAVSDLLHSSFSLRNAISDDDGETFQDEIQSDASVPGEVRNDGFSKDNDGKICTEHYEVVTHMHRKFHGRQRCIYYAENEKDANTEGNNSTQGTDETQHSYISEHLRDFFVSGTSERKDDDANDVTKQRSPFQVEDLIPSIISGSTSCNGDASQGKGGNVDVGVPTVIVVFKKRMVHQYISEHIERALEAERKHTESKPGADSIIKPDDNPFHYNSSNHQARTHLETDGCIPRHYKQTSRQNRLDRRCLVSVHDCRDKTGFQVENDHSVANADGGINDSATSDAGSRRSHLHAKQLDESWKRKRADLDFDRTLGKSYSIEADDSVSCHDFVFESIKNTSCGISEFFRCDVFDAMMHVSSSIIDGVHYGLEGVQKSSDFGQTRQPTPGCSEEAIPNGSATESLHGAGKLPSEQGPVRPVPVPSGSKHHEQAFKAPGIRSKFHSAFNAAKSKRRRHLESKAVRQHGMTWSLWTPPTVQSPSGGSPEQRPASRLFHHPESGEHVRADLSAADVLPVASLASAFSGFFKPTVETSSAQEQDVACISKQSCAVEPRRSSSSSFTKLLKRVSSGGSRCSSEAPPTPTEEPSFFSRVFSGALDPVYPGDKSPDNHEGDWSETLSIVSTDAEIEDLWLAKVVLKRIAKARNTSVDDLIEDVCDKLDELESTLLNPLSFDKGPEEQCSPF